MPQKQVFAIQQDRRGYIWLGTMTGLVRFNGHDFVAIDPGERWHGLSIARIRLLPDGKLLLATYVHGPLVFDGVTCYPLIRDPQLTSGHVYDLQVEADGSILLAMDTGLYLIRGDSVTRFSTDEFPKIKNVTAVYRDRSQTIWIGTDDGPYRLARTRLEAVPFSRKVIDPRVNSIIQDKQDRIWISTNSGLFRAVDGQAEPVEVPGTPRSALYLSAIVDDTGTLWFGTSHGAVSLNGTTFSTAGEENGLCNNQVVALYVDAERNLWFGTNDGVSILRNSSFEYFDKRNGIGVGGVDDIFEDHAGRIWVASNNGGIQVMDGKRSFPVGEAQGLPSNFTYAVGEDARGRIIIGTRFSVSLWDRGVVKVLRTGVAVTTALTDSRRQVWIGTRRGLLLWNGSALVDPFPGAPVQELAISTLAEDTRGRIWIGTRAHGCHVWDGREFQRFDETNGLTNFSIWDIAVDREGTVWVGTNGEGIYRYDGTRFSHLQGRRDDTGSRYVWQILADRAGFLWFGTNSGVERYDGANTRLYTTEDGLAGNEGSVGACLEDSRGRRWFGSSAGLSRYVGDQPEDAPFNPPVVLERILTVDGSLPTDKPFRIESSQSLTFSFAALFYRNGDAVEYRHMIEGLDADWSSPSREGSLGLRGLPPGEYRLNVQAGYRGAWGESKTLAEFAVIPPMYLSAWFIILSLAVAALVVVGIFRWRTWKIRSEKELLEQKVQERTKELREANRELAAFNTAVSNNLRVPLRHITGYSELLISGSSSRAKGEASDHYLRKITESAGRMETLINDLLNLAEAGSQEIHDDSVNLSLYARLILKELTIGSARAFELDIQDDLSARGSDKLLHLALLLLFDNAWKFTRGRDVTRIAFTAVEQDGERVFQIHDNGIGFPAEAAEQIFQPFSLLNSQDDFPGTGLGLFTVRRIILRHNGRIWAEGAPDSGATISFTLPD